MEANSGMNAFYGRLWVVRTTYAYGDGMNMEMIVCKTERAYGLMPQSRAISSENNAILAWLSLN